jgi:hypothetical protein
VHGALGSIPEESTFGIELCCNQIAAGLGVDAGDERVLHKIFYSAPAAPVRAAKLAVGNFT